MALLTDAVIATQINDGLKHCITGCARSAAEASNTNLRATFAQISQDGIRRQAELARMMQQKGWYTAPTLNPSNIQRIMPQLHALVQGARQQQSTQPFGMHGQGQPVSAAQHLSNQGSFGTQYTSPPGPQQQQGATRYS